MILRSSLIMIIMARTEILGIKALFISPTIVPAIVLFITGTMSSLEKP